MPPKQPNCQSDSVGLSECPSGGTHTLGWTPIGGPSPSECECLCGGHPDGESVRVELSSGESIQGENHGSRFSAGAQRDEAATMSRTDWSTAPTIFVEKPTCPHCGSAAYDRVRTVAGGDGSTTKRVRCRACRQPYKICVELPEPGDSTVWLS